MADQEQVVWLDQPLMVFVGAGLTAASVFGEAAYLVALAVAAVVLWRIRHTRRPDWPCTPAQEETP